METPLTNPAASGAAVPGEPGKLSGPARHRLIVLAMTLGALVLAWVNMAFISADDPWYRNTDMNIHNMADALAINAGQSPNTVDQPGLPAKFLLALDYRLRHELGLLPVWNLRQFGASPDPLHEIPALIRIARIHSRILVLLLILAAAGLIYVVTRELESACLTVMLLCGSSGLLFHGLLIRPELLCVGFGNVLVLLCTWRATGAGDWRAKHAWLIAAGLLGGIAAFEKLPGVCFLALGYTWCWLAALIDRAENPTFSPRREHPGFWRGSTSAVAGTLVLLLLFQLKDLHEILGPVVVQRLRVIAVAVALLPLLALRPATHRLWRFLSDRGQELACLAAGAIASIPLSYLLLRTVMNEQAASTYVARILHFLVNPTPSMKLFLATEPEIGRQFLAFLKESPVLLFFAVAGVIAVCLVRGVSLRLKAFSLLLLAGGLGITLLMSRRFFADQYTIFLQVPLLLVLSLSMAGFGAWWRQRQAVAGVHWTTPLVFTAALALTLTVYARLKPKYSHYQDDVTLPVRDLTLTFIFDHDAHPATYLQIMRDRYGSRKEFAATLEAFLADSAPRK